MLILKGKESFYIFRSIHTRKYIYTKRQQQQWWLQVGERVSNGSFNTKKKVTMQVICNTEMKLAAMKHFIFFLLHEHYAISFKLNQAFSFQKQLSCA